ncbi:MAG: hypothetical protein ACOYA8_08665 [Clostridium sp.]|jgi:hypothetical protein
MEGDKIYNIPYSLLELERLERYLEEKAARGFLFQKFESSGLKGRFQETAGQSWYFSIGLYDGKIGKKEKETEDFSDFCAKWESRGWIFTAAVGNLAVFRSDEKARPQEPEEKRIGWKEKKRLEILNHIEKKRMMGGALWAAAIALAYLLLANVMMVQGKSWGYILAFGVLLFELMWNQTEEVLARFQRRHLAKKYVDTGRETGGAVEYEAEVMLGFLFQIPVSLVMAFLSLRALAVGAFWLGILGVVFQLFLLAAALRIRKYKEAGRREKGIRRCYLLITLPLILILLSYFNFPKQGNYRYQNEPGTMSAAEGGRDWNKASRYPSPRDLGAEEDWICWLEQSNLACRKEGIVYLEEVQEDLDFQKDNMRKRLRYVGTVQAELLDESLLWLYLNQKGIDIKKAALLEQDGDRSYYRSASGKELISIGGTRVIICFLNDFDPREFPEDGGTALDKIRTLSKDTVLSIP